MMREDSTVGQNAATARSGASAGFCSPRFPLSRSMPQGPLISVVKPLVAFIFGRMHYEDIGIYAWVSVRNAFRSPNAGCTVGRTAVGFAGASVQIYHTLSLPSECQTLNRSTNEMVRAESQLELLCECSLISLKLVGLKSPNSLTADTTFAYS